MKKSMSGKQAQNPIIEVKEEFMPYGTKALDSKDRITLGGRLKEIIGIKMSVEGFMVYVGKNGDILLRPSVSVPSSEAWIYENPGVIGSVRKGLQEAGEGKLTRVNDIASFLKKL
jgi:hypothetical protein